MCMWSLHSIVRFQKENLPILLVKQKDILFEDEHVILMKQWYGPNAPIVVDL